MPAAHSILHSLSPAKCRYPWDSMDGSDLVRTCPLCHEKVYNVVGLDEKQLADVVVTDEPATDLATIQFFRRADGKLMRTRGECGNFRSDKTLLVDALFICLPIFNSEAPAIYVLGASLVVANTLRDLIPSRFSKKQSMAFLLCLAVIVSIAFMASLGYGGDVAVVRVLYLVLVPPFIMFHAFLVGRNSVDKAFLQMEMRNG